MRLLVSLLVLLLVAGMLLLTAAAHGATKDELQKRFKDRYPALRQFKTEGKIGERWDGYAEAVKAEHMNDAKVAEVVNGENADRKELYRLIAEDEKTTPESVAERAGKRNFEKAASGDYLKTSDGKWRRKA